MDAQEDKDLVHEFVQNDGLACLIRVGHTADQNFQNYILRGIVLEHSIVS
jgi:hypothetical protein